MSIKITIEDLFEIPSAEIINPDGFKTIKSVSIDSRNIPSGCLFIAIKGKKFDGHNFITEVIKNGTSAIMVNRKKLNKLPETELPIVAVDDTVKALGDLAAIWRKKISAKVIAITGSAGKTTTKEALAVILKEKYTVSKTESNNNNHIGVPLTILATPASKDILVLELGTNHFGEIAYTAAIASPDIAMITNIGSSHLEYLEDKNGVLKEKKALFESAEKAGGTILLNNDDKLLSKLGKKYKNVFTYGLKDGSSFSAKIAGYNNGGCAEVEVKCPWDSVIFTSPLPGEHNAMNLISVTAAALSTGLTSREIIKGLKKVKAVDKRLNIKKKKNFVLIDDTYNANPESMKNAILLLSSTSEKRRVAVLGDMFELGEKGGALHTELGKFILIAKLDEVCFIGPLMKNAYEAVGTKIDNKYFANRNQLKKYLSTKDLKGSIVLIKGSRGMKMEEFVEAIDGRAKS